MQDTDNNQIKKVSYESMGTSWEISIWDEISDEELKIIKKEVFEMSDNFDNTYSRFIRSSLVWKIAESAGVYEVPKDFVNMLKMYMDFYEPCQKKLNPLIGFTISDLGYDDVYSLKEKADIRPTPDLFETVEILEGLEGHLSSFKIKTAQPVLFDFGALGKGYFVDKISDYLKNKGIKRFLVNGSGDIYYSGGADKEEKIPITVGLEHPSDQTKVIGTTEIKEGSMCASGTNRRKWGEYHHVIDPLTARSTPTEQGIIAVWVIAHSATLADALASCLFFVQPERLIEKGFVFEYVIMNADNLIKKSEGWKGGLF
jgi:thiamine biosynthesis lipoprotein